MLSNSIELTLLYLSRNISELFQTWYQMKIYKLMMSTLVHQITRWITTWNEKNSDIGWEKSYQVQNKFHFEMWAHQQRIQWMPRQLDMNWKEKKDRRHVEESKIEREMILTAIPTPLIANMIFWMPICHIQVLIHYNETLGGEVG